MPETSSLRQRLRAETRDAHEALETLLPITRRRDLETYRDHLRFLLTFHAPLEERLRRVDALAERVPDLEARWKAPRLRRDLEGESEHLETVPAEMLPAFSSLGGALGAFYVLEGATLGARGLLDEMRGAGVLPGPVGSAYLDAYGEQHGAMWRSFVEVLESLEDEEHDRAVEAARATFASLAAWRACYADSAHPTTTPARR